MKILYFSVHAILEYDEIRMFQSLGHTVFSLGAYYGGKASQPFRPEIDFDQAAIQEIMDAFQSMGGNIGRAILGVNPSCPQNSSIFSTCVW